MSVPRIIYAAAGSPDYPHTHEGTCRTCGYVGRGIPFGEWVKDTFTNFDLLRPGEIVCEACLFVTDTRSPALTALTGRDKLQRMVNYSHFVVDGVWSAYHKGQKAEILTALRSNPTVAVIAVSGQKHLCFRARQGWWQIEEQSVLPNLPLVEHCLEHILALYHVFNKTEIGLGNYSPNRMVKYTQEYGAQDMLEHQRALVQYRGTIYFELALYLAKNTTESEEIDE